MVSSLLPLFHGSFFTDASHVDKILIVIERCAQAYVHMICCCTFDLLSMSLLGFFTMSPTVTIEIVDPVVISNRIYFLFTVCKLQ